LTDFDKRCCGRGVCIINEKGECWCGQIWDNEKMIKPKVIPINPTKVSKTSKKKIKK
jgi:hypothetical protein